MKNFTILSILLLIITLFAACANAEYGIEEGSIFYTKEKNTTKEKTVFASQYENPEVQTKESETITNFEGSYNQNDGFE